MVSGFGEKKPPKAFVSACNKFIFTEVLRSKDDDIEKIRRKTTNELKKDTKLVNLLRNAVEASSDDSGWAHLASVGSNIAKQAPEFDPRNYGYEKLGTLHQQQSYLKSKKGLWAMDLKVILFNRQKK